MIESMCRPGLGCQSLVVLITSICPGKDTTGKTFGHHHGELHQIQFLAMHSWESHKLLNAREEGSTDATSFSTTQKIVSFQSSWRSF